jgi:hypothetical protein
MEPVDDSPTGFSWTKSIVVLLALLTALIHTFLGGADALQPMLSAELPDAAEGGMHGAWHIVTVFLFWSCFAFWNGGATSRTFAGLWIAAAIVFVYVGISQSGLTGLIVNPQWTILGLTGALALWANRANVPQ